MCCYGTTGRNPNSSDFRAFEATRSGNPGILEEHVIFFQARCDVLRGGVAWHTGMADGFQTGFVGFVCRVTFKTCALNLIMRTQTLLAHDCRQILLFRLLTRGCQYVVFLPCHWDVSTRSLLTSCFGWALPCLFFS